MFGTNITVDFREENKVKYFDEAEDEEKEDTQYE